MNKITGLLNCSSTKASPLGFTIEIYKTSPPGALPQGLMWSGGFGHPPVSPHMWRSRVDKRNWAWLFIEWNYERSIFQWMKAIVDARNGDFEKDGRGRDSPRSVFNSANYYWLFLYAFDHQLSYAEVTLCNGWNYVFLGLYVV